MDAKRDAASPISARPHERAEDRIVYGVRSKQVEQDHEAVLYPAMAKSMPLAMSDLE
jgi:hypothetical protein